MRPRSQETLLELELPHGGEQKATAREGIGHDEKPLLLLDPQAELSGELPGQGREALPFTRSPPIPSEAPTQTCVANPQKAGR